MDHILFAAAAYVRLACSVIGIGLGETHAMAVAYSILDGQKISAIKQIRQWGVGGNNPLHINANGLINLKPAKDVMDLAYKALDVYKAYSKPQDTWWLGECDDDCASCQHDTVCIKHKHRTEHY